MNISSTSQNLSTPSVLLSMTEFDHLKELTTRIIRERQAKAVAISSFLKSKLNIIKARRRLIIKKIIEWRNEKAKIIQSRFRIVLIRKEVKGILTSSHFFFFYSLNETVISKLFQEKDQLIKHVKMKLFLGQDTSITVTFNYSKCLQLFYVPIRCRGPLKRRIRVNFIINDQCIIDPRFEVDTNERGEYYNIIIHSMLYKPMRRRRYHAVTIEPPSKFWENIFQIKKRQRGSCDSSSLSEKSIDHYLSTNTNMIMTKDQEEPNKIKQPEVLKTILKRKENKSAKKKKVNFNNDVEYVI